jgi:hypothetical protein
MVKRFELATAPLPFKLPLMREMVQYHRARVNDGGLQWLLGRMVAMAAASGP